VVADHPCERLVKIGDKIVWHGRSITFQMAEVLVRRGMFRQILATIATLRPSPQAHDAEHPHGSRHIGVIGEQAHPKDGVPA
jgi:hypothetical protein